MENYTDTTETGGRIVPENKIPSIIKKIVLNRATFQNAAVDNLTFVNFFYGNNGTGKSTIARCIRDGDGLEYDEDRLSENFEVLVYDRDFISENFSSYDGLKGVFTVNKENIEILKQIDEKKAQKQVLQDKIVVEKTNAFKKQEEFDTLQNKFQDECFKKTEKFRADFSEALIGRKQKKGFVDALLAERCPTKHDPEELKRLYNTAYDRTAREYPTFSQFNFAAVRGKTLENELLHRPIVSRSNTPFAQFISALNATDWVRHGHEHYVKNANGKCPFCQKPLDDDFESQIAACFDGQYQQDINALIDFQRTYIAETDRLISVLKHNLADVPPCSEITDYKFRLAILENSIEINRQRLAEKVKAPATIVFLENTDSLLLEIGALITKINQSIFDNNSIVKAQEASKKKCRDELMQFFAFFLADEIKKYRAEKATLEKDIKESSDVSCEMGVESVRLDTEIADLNSKTVNTADAMNAINNWLKKSGFQGFSLCARPNADNTYDVVRENGEIARDLSEGELNFIAFLYFNQIVCGSLDKAGSKNKIVVIDDPVSSMDSTSLFFISGIIRTMIDTCRNNLMLDPWNLKGSGNFIKQIFILTHNVYFHRKITHKQIEDYASTSLYIIRKAHNKSTIKLCVREDKKENYNPVQNSYTTLWDELRNAQHANIAKNVMRLILEHYFLQLCGYDGENLRERILESEEHKDKFIVPAEDGEPDTSNYMMAMSLLSYIDATPSVSDDISFTEDNDDVEGYKNVLKLIFDVLGQSQHYNMMMRGQR